MVERPPYTRKVTGSSPVRSKFRAPLRGAFSLGRKAHKLLYARQDLKGTAMFLFERVQAAKGKNREPGLQKNSVRSFTGRQVLSGPPFKKASCKRCLFCWVIYPTSDGEVACFLSVRIIECFWLGIKKAQNGPFSLIANCAGSKRDYSISISLFPKLHFSHNVCKLSKTVSPPLDQGFLWSTCNLTLGFFAGDAPQAQHVK